LLKGTVVAPPDKFGKSPIPLNCFARASLLNSW